MTVRFAIYLLLLGVLACFGLIKFGRLTPPFRVLTVLICITIVSEAVGRALAKTIHSSMPVYHITCIVEYVCYATMYFYFFKNRYIKKVVLYSIPIIVILSVINSIYFESFRNIRVFPSNIPLISLSIYLYYSMMLFQQMLNENTGQSLYKRSMFWFNIGMVLYAVTMFMFFSLNNYFLRKLLRTDPITDLSYIVNLVFYVLMFIALLTDKKQGGKVVV